MPTLTRLATAAASNGLLTGQSLFSRAFVCSCELPKWINGPREANACRSRSTALALFFLSGMQTAIAESQPALAPARRVGFHATKAENLWANAKAQALLQPQPVSTHFTQQPPAPVPRIRQAVSKGLAIEAGNAGASDVGLQCAGSAQWCGYSDQTIERGGLDLYRQSQGSRPQCRMARIKTSSDSASAGA